MPTDQLLEPSDPGPPDSADDVVRASVNARSLSLAVIATTAVVFVLRYAWELLLPIVLAVLISYAFDPIVIWLTRRRIPRGIGAALVLAVFVGAVGYGVYSLRDDALAIVKDLPASAKKLRQSMHELHGDNGTLQTLTKAVAEIEKTAEVGAGAAPSTPGVTRVQVEDKPFDIMQYLWWGSMGVVGLVGQAILVVFLVYFLLASGDLYRRKLVKIVGPKLSRQRVTVRILQEITAQVERFLFVQMLTSALVALASSIAFRWLGLERALFWGAFAGLLNSIPYFGPIIVVVGVGAVAFVQFGSLDKTVQVAAMSLLITGLEGFLLTPYLLGKSLKMNGVAVFVGLMFWGWLWGVWGMLLAMPMLVAIKSICDHVEDLQGIGDMLGE